MNYMVAGVALLLQVSLDKSLNFQERFLRFRYFKRMPHMHDKRPYLNHHMRAVCIGFVDIAHRIIQKHFSVRNLYLGW